MNRRRFLQYAAVGAASYGLSRPAWSSLLPPDAFFSQSFPDLLGHEHPLSRYQGSPLIVNFWATWCKPCIEEMPDLQALHERYPDMPMLGLAVDRAQNVEGFLRKIPVSYDILLAASNGVPVMRALGNRSGGLPFTVAFNAKGRVSERMLGQINPRKLDDVIHGLLVN